MLVAFVGIHVPLLALIGYFLWLTMPSLQVTLPVLGVALVATLLGTAITLFVLDQLLRPILMTAQGLRAYATNRAMPALPTEFTDEAGTLMADAMHTLVTLDAALNELASFDAATGLPNRDTLLRDLRAAMARPGARLALCVLGVRNDKSVKSAFGQEKGEAVIRMFARGLQQALGAGVAIARIRASQFAVRLDSADPATVAARMGAVLGALRREISLEGFRLVPELACGIALFPDDAAGATGLLDNAISAAAMATARADKTPVFYSPASREAVRRRFALEQELRGALEREEFVLYYQPVVDTTAERIVAAEALIRWRPPGRGLILPGLFIPAAESSGLIEPIGQWVVQAASRQLRDWSAAGIDPVKVAVNLSAAQFRSQDTIPLIGRTLAADQVDPRLLEVEMTETVAMQDETRTRAVFEQLRTLGVSIAIDDFGTGYSSIGTLRTLPVDKLKIDRAFVSGVDAAGTGQAICKAMIELARGLGIAVVAEGTESLAEVRAMQALGCTLFQGYYYARPMAAADFAALLRTGLPAFKPGRVGTLAAGPARL